MLDAGVDLRDIQIAARHADREPSCSMTERARISTGTRTTSWLPTWPQAPDPDGTEDTTVPKIARCRSHDYAEERVRIYGRRCRQLKLEHQDCISALAELRFAAPTVGICCPRGGCRGKSLTRQAGTRRRRAARPTTGAADDRGREGRRIISRQAAGSAPGGAADHAAGCHGILAGL